MTKKSVIVYKDMSDFIYHIPRELGNKVPLGILVDNNHAEFLFTNALELPSEIRKIHHKHGIEIYPLSIVKEGDSFYGMSIFKIGSLVIEFEFDSNKIWKKAFKIGTPEYSDDVITVKHVI